MFTFFKNTICTQQYELKINNTQQYELKINNTLQYELKIIKLNFKIISY